ARIGGLSAALAADPQLKEMVSKRGPNDLPMFSRDPITETPPLPRQGKYDMPPYVPGLGFAQNVVDAAFQMATPNWESPAASQPSTQIAVTQPSVASTQPAPKVRLLQLAKGHNRIVMELRKFEPVREDQYLAQRAEAVQSLVRSR